MIDNSQELIVSVNCIAYNQEKYIKDCLDGIVMQKTTFRFEAIVHDDASTDGTADIIKEYSQKYPKIIKPIFEKENQWSKNDGSLDRIMLDACKGKYIAFCEGDDYWIDPYKLQKQVDYLETHSEYSLVYTRVKCWKETVNNFVDIIGQNTNFIQLLCTYNVISTPSMLIRRNSYLKYFADINPYEKKWKMGDYPLVLYISKLSKIKLLSDVTCVYRSLNNSTSHSDKESSLYPYYDSIFDIQIYFYRFFNINNKKILNNIYLTRLNLLFSVFLKTNDKYILKECKELLKKTFLYKIKDIVKFGIVLKYDPLISIWKSYSKFRR